MDGGPVLAWREFAMREATKSSLYRNEATEAAVAGVLEALAEIASGAAATGAADAAPGRARPHCSSQARRIDFARDDIRTALAKIRSADGAPGAAARLFGREMRIFDAHAANLSGAPGEIIARSGPALGVALGDGAIWIGHVRAPERLSVKLPATLVFGPECEPLAEREGYPGVRCQERGEVGLLEFPFYNGAMGTQACADLRAAVAKAGGRPTRVLVLTGGPDYWSNGLDLARIEASRSPAEESWANINAMNDLVREIVQVRDKCRVGGDVAIPTPRRPGRAGFPHPVLHGRVSLAVGVEDAIRHSPVEKRTGVMMSPPSFSPVRLSVVVSWRGSRSPKSPPVFPGNGSPPVAPSFPCAGPGEPSSPRSAAL
jgi:putative two-component system hydrogenase maturation factor HypX/HoxX